MVAVTSLLPFMATIALVIASPSITSRQTSEPFPGLHTGDGTFTAQGLGDCGFVNTDSDFVVYIDHILFDSYPGYNGVNPNTNPVCGRSLTAIFQGRGATVKVVGSCPGCSLFGLDFSPAAFAWLAGDLALGRISGVDWHFN